jgi:signal transduction histidine kinase
MRPRLLITFLFITLLPIGLLTWLGTRAKDAESLMLANRLDAQRQRELEDVAVLIQEVLRERELEALRALENLGPDSDSMRAMLRTLPRFSQAFALDEQGHLVHPPALRNDGEEAFIARSRSIWESGELFYRPKEMRKSPRYGWHSWFWGKGVNLLFWQLRASQIVGFELDRARLIADIIAVMPDDLPPHQLFGPVRIDLVDSSDQILHQWGSDQELAQQASIQLAPPLAAWRLRYHSGESTLAGGRPWFNILAGVGAVGIAVLALALYFYREQTRELREASQRVNFVNQVSHELKTPLTNIRMYAELLDESLPEKDARERRYVSIIVSESQRLSRLIGNVLTFARQQRDRLEVQRSEASVDIVISNVVDQFKPALEEAGVVSELDLHAAEPAFVDADLLERVVVNLLSNVEKYAASGGRVRIESSLSDAMLSVRVRDFGSGIPPAERERVFAPFHRISHKLSDGVTGTGIGLNIARNLARSHGGDLRLVEVDSGACFELTLNVRKPEGTG